jgi:uncharacterized membrane protein YebE (DUF533 family)
MTMIDLDRIMSGLSRSGAAAGLAGGLVGKTLGKVAQVGGLALVGGLAWKAYQQYRNGNPSPFPGPSTAPKTAWTPATATGPQAPGTSAALAAAHRWQDVRRQDFEAVTAEPATEGSRSVLLIRAMIAAAMADGHLDSGEQGRLFREIDRLELTVEEKGMMLEELRRPWSIDRLATSCHEPETAIEVYVAALLAIDETRPEGAAWLDQLARALMLPPALIEAIRVRARQEESVPLAEPA